MANFKDLLPAASQNQEAFILDHGKKENGVLKYKDDLTSYGWNVKRFNKMHEGAFVLNRRPGKMTDDRKFEIYSGGYIDQISEPDEDGNVVAVISHAFNIVPPLKQGDSFLENFVWSSKIKKTPDSWAHFWNQYGMNTISYQDFERLLEHVNCVPIGGNVLVSEKTDITKEEADELEQIDANGFNVTFDDNDPVSKGERKASGVAKKIDFDRIQKSRNQIEALGEEIVMDILTKKAETEGCKLPIHVSKEEGDSFGYDIRAFDKDGNEIHVEVKTSKGNYADGFELSYNEVKASRVTDYKYMIYRVYGLNIKSKTCRIKVYDGPVNSNTFKLIVTKVAVYQK